jgi:hypothetical protein
MIFKSCFPKDKLTSLPHVMGKFSGQTGKPQGEEDVATAGNTRHDGLGGQDGCSDPPSFTPDEPKGEQGSSSLVFKIK